MKECMLPTFKEKSREMNAWLRVVCGICCTKSALDENYKPTTFGMSPLADSQNLVSESTPSQTATAQVQISSPYILISECYSGSRISSSLPKTNVEHSGSYPSQPVSLVLKNQTKVHSSQFLNDQSDEDAFLEPPMRGAVTCDYRRESTDEVTVSSLRMDPLSDLFVLPPDRPPKPSHLILGQSRVSSFDNYANTSDVQEVLLREANNNLSFDDPFGAPPSVSRGLKPGRQISSGTLTTSTTGRGSPTKLIPSGPPVERSLKPTTPPRLNHNSSSVVGSHPRPPSTVPNWSIEESFSQVDEKLSNHSACQYLENDEQIYYYLPALNISSTTGSKQPPLMIPADAMEHSSVAYIDLDLPKLESDHGATNSRHIHVPVSNRSSDNDSPSTIYKTIDIAKTDAFNKTKRDLEHQRLKSG